MTDLLKSLLKASGDQYASIAADGIVGNKNSYNIDTGCYALNALISSSIYKGLPSNRRLAFAAPSSTGKTFFSLQMLYHFLEDNPKAIAFYFDTEKAVDEEMLESRGIDSKRVVVSQPSTVEEFRTYAAKVLDEYEKHIDVDSDEEQGNKMMIFLDSLGMLSSEAELENISSGNNKADMGRTQKLLKATFRALSLRTARMNVPWCIVGHTYANLGGFGDSIAGGTGLVYASDVILTLSKSQVKEGTVHTGVQILCTAFKSRLTKEKSQVRVNLMFDKGLQKYSGLLEIAEASGIFKKVGNKYSVPIDSMEGKTYFGKAINNNPEKFFTPEILDMIDEWTKENFTYGSSNTVQITEDLDNE